MAALGIWKMSGLPIFAAIAGVGAWINLFNLIPIGTLDGGRGFHPMDRVQKLLATATAPAPIPEHLTVLTLSVIIGYYVIGKVSHSLHTPLMSITNAISGVMVVGAMLQLSGDSGQNHDVILVLAALATLLVSINVFAGFAVTRRMLSMFRREN